MNPSAAPVAQLRRKKLIWLASGYESTLPKAMAKSMKPAVAPTSVPVRICVVRLGVFIGLMLHEIRGIGQGLHEILRRCNNLTAAHDLPSVDHICVMGDKC